MAVSTPTVTSRVCRCGAFPLCILLGLASRALPAGRPEAGPTAESVVIARTEYRIEAVPGEITWTAATRLDVTGPGLDRLTATLPPDLQIVRIAGDSLASWKSETSRGRRPKQTVELRFRRALSGEREIALTGILTHPPDQPWSVPPLVLDGVDAHTGRARLVCAEHCDLALEDLDGARPVIDETAQTDLVFDLWQEDFRLEFTTREKDRSVQADLLTRLTLARDRIELQAVAELRPLRAPLFELQLAIPSGWQVSEARLDERLVPWHSLAEHDGVCDLRIPLPEPIPAGRTTRLELRASLALPETDEPSREVPLPAVSLPQAATVRGRYVIDHSNEIDAELSDLSGLRAAADHEIGEALAYEHDTRSIAGTLRITPRPVAGPAALQDTIAGPAETVATAGLQPVPVPATVAAHAHTCSKLDAAGRTRHRVKYVLPSEVSSLLVRLPPTANLCQALAGETPIPVRQNGKAIEVRLPAPSREETERTISVVYDDEHAPLGASGTLQFQSPTVRAIDQLGHESQLEVLEQHWSIQPPSGVLLYESHDAFHPVHPLRSSGWLAAVLQAISSPAGTIWTGLLLVAAFALARLRAPRKLWRITAAAALVIAAAGLLASARPVLGGAGSQALGQDTESAPAGTLFRAILPAADVPLSVRYATRVHSTTARCAAAACAVFVLWLFRRRGPTFRGLLAAAGLAAPLAALPFVDAAQHVWLDGIVVGTLGALLLWRVGPFTVPLIKASPALTRSAAALLIFAAVAGSTRGEQPVPPIRADSALAVRIGDEGVYLRGHYDLRALSGSLNELSFALPENVKVRAVTGPHVAGWHTERDGEPARVVVRFDKSVGQRAEVFVELFQPISFPEGTTTWDLPAFRPLHLTSHCGTVSARVPGHLTAAVASTQGLRRIDSVLHRDEPRACQSQPCVRDEGSQLARAPCSDAPTLSWALTGGDIALALEITRPFRQCDVLAAHSAVVEPQRLRLSSRFRITHPGAPSLRFTAFVPEGYRPVDLRAPHVARWSFDDGLLTVWFDRPQSGTVEVELDLEAVLQPDAPSVEIAVPLPLDSARARSLLGVWVDGRLEPSVDMDALSGWLSVHGTAARDEVAGRDRDPPVLLLANDSPEPLPILVGLTLRRPPAATEPEPIPVQTAAEPQPPDLPQATPEAVIETARLAVALRRDGACRIEARYRVRSRARRSLPVLLPAGMRLLAADVDGRTVTLVRPADESPASILIPLADRTEALAEVRLLLAARLPRALPAGSRFFGRDRIDVPAPQIPTAQAHSEYGLPVVRTVWEVSVPNSIRADLTDKAAALTVASRGDPLTVQQTGSPGSLRLTVSPPSPAGSVSLIAAAVLAAGVWTVVRRPRSPQVPVACPAPPEPPTIAALPHDSGIFSATRRANEPAGPQ